ncbi:MAG: hypothetical protein V3S69_03405 [Dehalococcoidales bacterium]
MVVQVKDPIHSVIETSARGGKSLAVTLQDQTTEMLDLPFLEAKVSGLTLGADTVIDTRNVTLAGGHGLTSANSAGHIIELAHLADGHFYQGEILSIAGDVVTLAPPMNDTYTVATTVVGTGNPNMAADAATGVAIDGSSTPVVFTIKPIPGQAGDIVRVVMAATSSNDMDLTTFGGAPELVVGATLRVKRTNGTYRNLFTYKSNFDIAIHGFDTNTFLPKGGNTTKGFLARVTFGGQSKHGVVVRLDGILDEELQIVISELMDSTASGNINVSFVGEGSELQGE